MPEQRERSVQIVGQHLEQPVREPRDALHTRFVAALLASRVLHGEHLDLRREGRQDRMEEGRALNPRENRVESARVPLPGRFACR